MDYDATTIPEAYDRSRSHGPDILDLWMKTVRRYSSGRPLSRILDLGCGTGRFTDALATSFGASVIGLDPSRKMLAQAHRKPTKGQVNYIRGAGERLPVAEESCDLVFMSMVFHHFAARSAVVRECRRVLRDGALVFLRAGTLEQIDAYPYVEFIPATRPLLRDRLSGREDITSIFEGLGFSTVAEAPARTRTEAGYAPSRLSLRPIAHAHRARRLTLRRHPATRTSMDYRLRGCA